MGHAAAFCIAKTYPGSATSTVVMSCLLHSPAFLVPLGTPEQITNERQIYCMQILIWGP